MLKKWYWWLLAVVVYLCFLVAYAPAGYLTEQIEKNSNKQVQFVGVSGTIFSGNAKQVFAHGVQINNVDWQLSALNLLVAQVKLDLTGGAVRDSEQVSITSSASTSLFNRNTFTLKDTQVFYPANAVFAQFQLPVPITASGRLRVDIDELEYNEKGCSTLQGKGNWLNANVSVNGKAVDLEQFDATLACANEQIELKVSPNNGLSLDATVRISANGSYRATGRFTIPNNYPQEMRQGASFFGVRQNDGSYTLDIAN